ncbi:hypothetical protein Scep_002554 [Stephania cephalantha]|uniref:Uncharacterized protein n=1 Tax=Stephania cephalantha TaxID=152367 RepID=A0AAP0Q531_9MAGN
MVSTLVHMSFFCRRAPRRTNITQSHQSACQVVTIDGKTRRSSSTNRRYFGIAAGLATRKPVANPVVRVSEVATGLATRPHR